LGGTSVINFMFYMRGSVEEWNRLAKITGDDGWSWKSILPLARQSEQFVLPTEGRDISKDYDPGAHGYSGPIRSSLANSAAPMYQKIMQAAHETDDPRFRYNKDINAGYPLGVGWLPGSNGAGTRSTSTDYLTPEVTQRSNLHILTGAHVTKILFKHGHGIHEPVATGVEFQYSKSGPKYVAHATKEVILSAGAINSPQILLLSGIGDKAQLNKFKIPVVRHLPDVGKNFQDHTILFNQVYVNSTATWDDVFRDPKVYKEAQAEFNGTRTGPFVNLVGQAVGFFRLPPDSPIYKEPGVKDDSPGPRTPQIELLFGDGFISTLAKVPAQGHFASLAVVGLSPSSRGTVTLQSADPFVAPLIDPAFFTEKIDLELTIQGIRAGRDFVKSPAFAGHIGPEYGPVSHAHTDAELEAYIRQYTVALWHPTSTTALSAKGSSTGVLDPDLTVKGVKGLRVVDAGAFPYVPAAHPQGLIYILAERASEIIAAKYK